MPEEGVFWDAGANVNFMLFYKDIFSGVDERSAAV